MEDKIRSFIVQKIDEVEELEEASQIQEIVKQVKETFQVQCKYFHAGGYDSPGYDIECYVIAYIDEQGELQGVDVEIESC